VWNLCPFVNMHGIIYRHIGRTGLGWIDGQKSPVFRRGKSGNPSVELHSLFKVYYSGVVNKQIKKGLLLGL